MLIGETSMFRITVRNVGNVEAKDVLVSVNLPPWVELAGKSPSAGATRLSADGDSGTLEWQIRQMSAVSREHLDLQIIPRQSKPVELTVRWTVAPVVSRAVIEVQEPKLEMVISGPDQVLYGETKLYEMVISNPGTGPAEDVVVNLFSLDGGSRPAATHKIGTLEPGTSKKLEVELTAGEAGTLDVKASAVGRAGLRSDVVKKVIVLRPGLQLELAGPRALYAGTVATYRIRITNPGTAMAHNVTITATIPGGAKYLSGSDQGQGSSADGKVSWQIASLQPGGERMVDLHCQLISPGQNRLQVIGRGDSDLLHEIATMTDVIAMADLKLEVSDPAGPVAVGEEAVYEIRISNRGTKSAESIQVSSYFSAGVEPVGVEGAQHKIGNDGQVLFRPIDSIQAGEHVVLKIRAKAGRPGNHIFRTEVQCPSLDTKLAAEETTLFYGSDLSIGTSQGTPRTAARPNSLAPQIPTPAQRPL